MTFFEYISVFVSIIVALGITQLLLGLSRLIEKPEGQRVYWVHLVWVVWLFLALLFFWWAEFSLVAIEEWTFYAYSVVTLFATILFFLATILFPSGIHEGIDFRKKFFERRRWFFSMLLTWLAVDQLDTLVKGIDHYVELGIEYPLTAVVMALLFTVAIVTANRRFHGVLAVAMLTWQLQWIFSNYFSVA